MKKLNTIFLISLAFILLGQMTKAETYSEVINQSKPCAVLIYADWADDAQKALLAFNAQSKQKNSKYNFATLNIADKETKEFNKTYHIYPNLPYVLLFRDKGKISRLIKKDCVLSDSCFKDRLDLFIN